MTFTHRANLHMRCGLLSVLLISCCVCLTPRAYSLYDGQRPPAPLSVARNETVSQLFALAEAYRALQTPEGLRRALPYAWAAAQLAPFTPGANTRQARVARHNAELLFSLTAHHAAVEAHGRRSAELLTRLLSDAAVSRAHSRGARSNAEFLLEQAASRRWNVEEDVWTRLRAALVTREPQCTHKRILLAPDAADDAPGGLCAGMAEVVVLALPHRIAHADAFVRSLGCRSYVRFDAVTAPVPSERYAAVDLPNRFTPTAGVTRLYTAYASCVLPFVAGLPAGARVGIFEDDVDLVAAGELTRVAADMQRLLAVGGADAAALYFFGTCYDDECNMPERLLSVHDLSLVKLRRHFRCTHAFAATPAGAAKALRLLGADANSTLVINEAIDEAISGFVELGLLDAFAFKPSLLDQTVAADSNNPETSVMAYLCDEFMRHGAWPTTPPPPQAPALRRPADPLVVTPRLFAGLGNQLFMMAAACGFAEALGAGAQCALSSRGIEPSPHAAGGSYAGSVFQHFGVTDLAPDMKYEEPVFAANLHLPPPASLPRGSSHLQLSGYFQHEAYVPLDFASRIWLPPAQARPHTAFVHARRGDFVGSPLHDVGMSGEAGAYFVRAMALLREKHAHAGLSGLRFLVFSDDAGWASHQPAFFAPDVDFYEAPPGEDDELHALAAMAQCEAGGVGSNSSFSWWAAFLNRNPNKTVVFPSVWYGDGDSLVDDTPFHGSFRVPVKAGGETTRVDREGAPWRQLGL
jgi:Glycosyl transferase family 11